MVCDAIFLFLIGFVVFLVLFRRIDDFLFVCFCIVVVPALLLFDIAVYVRGRLYDVLYKS